MAKGDVTLKLDAETAAFIQKVMAARSALDATAQKTREFGESVDKGSDSLERMGDHLKETVMEVIGVGSAVEVLKETFDASFEDMAERSETVRKNVLALQDVLAGMGHVELTPKITEDIDKAAEGVFPVNDDKESGVTGMHSMATQAIHQLGGKVSDEAGIKAVLDAMRTAGQMGINDPQDVISFGVQAGNMMAVARSAQGPMKDWTEKQIIQATETAEKAGGLDDRTLQTMAKSSNPIEVMQLAIDAAKSEVSKRALPQVEAYVESINDFDPNKRPGLHSTPEERQEYRSKLELSKIPEGDRLGFLVDNIQKEPALAPATIRNLVELLSRNRGNDVQQDLASDDVAAQIEKERQLRQSDPASRALYQQQQAEIQKEKSLAPLEVPAASDEAVWKQDEADIAQYTTTNSALASIRLNVDKAADYIAHAWGGHSGQFKELKEETEANTQISLATDAINSGKLPDNLKQLASQFNDANRQLESYKAKLRTNDNEPIYNADEQYLILMRKAASAAAQLNGNAVTSQSSQQQTPSPATPPPAPQTPAQPPLEIPWSPLPDLPGPHIPNPFSIKDWENGFQQSNATHPNDRSGAGMGAAGSVAILGAIESHLQQLVGLTAREPQPLAKQDTAVADKLAPKLDRIADLLSSMQKSNPMLRNNLPGQG